MFPDGKHLRGSDTGMEKDKTATRKYRHLRVPVLEEEKVIIEQNAKKAGLAVAAYLRNLGLGYRITGIVDNHKVEELIHINADLGRLGGLLKMWLANEDRAKRFGKAHILNILERIDKTQDIMREAIKQVVAPRMKE